LRRRAPITYDPDVRPLRVLSLALVMALGLVPLLPAEHVHELETDGHRHLVVHQHSHFHSIIHLPEDRTGGPAFDHPDDPILTLSTVYTAPPPYVVAIPSERIVDLIQPPDAETGRGSNASVERLIHGPPRPRLSLRGPPHSSV
jgi:hypothetical protein